MYLPRQRFYKFRCTPGTDQGKDPVSFSVLPQITEVNDPERVTVLLIYSPRIGMQYVSVYLPRLRSYKFRCTSGTDQGKDLVSFSVLHLLPEHNDPERVRVPLIYLPRTGIP